MTTRTTFALPWRRTRAVERLTPGELPTRYLATVVRYTSARLGPGAEAEDVAAEVFAAAFASWKHCPTPAAEATDHDPVRAWLFGIARRKVVDALRRRQRHPESELSEAQTKIGAGSPELELLGDEALGQLKAVLATLPEDQREALRLKYVEELSLVEIGIILRRSPAAVGQLLHRARAAARAKGSAYFEETEL
ncbi:RNA polymerase sigma factor [Armatimonas rosea]|uniref:RNA polymerase sigma-70 factor (ECF subfamily) n=1 Tax=Armatimonas rosea TaxID=685828 RepID=A0A7W9SMG4_ARMRO|nr:sigma-70 family RNA polymerase sigma factor [Armatimonas rosea]MBB6049340.1 RNA polymerase sigma-70 factor (ECF subfamily) [Armatimonas rosea]